MPVTAEHDKIMERAKLDVFLADLRRSPDETRVGRAGDVHLHRHPESHPHTGRTDMTAETQTVPVEPTEAMLVNGREALLPLIRLDSYGPLIGVWKDMLAAAPAPAGELREAAQAILDRWDSPLWKELVLTDSLVNRLRAAVAALIQTERG